MTDRRDPITLPMMADRKDYLLTALFMIILMGIVGISVIPSWEPVGKILMGLALGGALISVAATLLRWGLTTVKLSEEGIEFYIGTVSYKKYRAEEIQTVAKLTTYTGKGGTIIKLVIQTQPAEALEATGEQALRKKPFASQDLKFRENRPDWKNVCLDAGLRKTGGSWIEYTPQRQQLLRELFPNASHLEAKPYIG